jgi:hypothetical protein
MWVYGGETEAKVEFLTATANSRIPQSNKPCRKEYFSTSVPELGGGGENGMFKRREEGELKGSGVFKVERKWVRDH